ncbi:ribonuclease III [Brumimicrobium salinarum]|uniref:Ribonuclease 3 n=1 Tax=Brumimicrobium salinarum TaxID=2058658 RepID=A0A2I0QZE2_9FLAO|nr:ribonuclease III [Brumimicrobium salinarum]PKR79705.1 ribonuclease III [Brumimicrobium salinarum]
MLRWFAFRSTPKGKKDLALIRFIIRKFGYRPKNLLLFKIALTHKSIANTSAKLVSNERLEFLGDTILDATIADYLYHKFPDKNEGHLTKVKSKMVSRKTLTKIAQSMQLSEHIVYQKGRSIRLATLEGNAFEALIGAIYLDGGYEAVKKSVFHTILRLHLDLPTLLEKEIDFKSKLFIWAQKNRLNIEFKTIREELLDGVWHYELEVYINSNPYGKGKGNSKKIAEQAASKETLDLMGIT